jgi:SAM-dependent methyltransferase
VDLDLLLSECNRVLKNRGCFVVSVPFVYKEHEQPHDFRRFTSYGLMLALSKHGFRVESCLKCLSGIETITTIFSVYVNNNIGLRSKFLHMIMSFFITAPLLVFASLLSKILPDNGDLYCTLVLTSFKSIDLAGETSQ